MFEAQTVAETYARLVQGEGFRLAVGNFTNAFFLYHPRERQALLDEPLPTLEIAEENKEQARRWAAFCAGAAEYLARRYKLHVPAWTQAIGQLEAEWCVLPASEAQLEALMANFRVTTPAPFKKRNVFCGDTVFSNPRRSSRERGSWKDRRRRLNEVLAQLPEAERAAYIAEHNTRVPAYLQLPA